MSMFNYNDAEIQQMYQELVELDNALATNTFSGTASQRLVAECGLQEMYAAIHVSERLKAWYAANDYPLPMANVNMINGTIQSLIASEIDVVSTTDV
jgi:hypothetical protein